MAAQHLIDTENVVSIGFGLLSLNCFHSSWFGYELIVLCSGRFSRSHSSVEEGVGVLRMSSSEGRERWYLEAAALRAFRYIEKSLESSVF